MKPSIVVKTCWKFFRWFAINPLFGNVILQRFLPKECHCKWLLLERDPTFMIQYIVILFMFGRLANFCTGKFFYAFKGRVQKADYGSRILSSLIFISVFYGVVPVSV